MCVKLYIKESINLVSDIRGAHTCNTHCLAQLGSFTLELNDLDIKVKRIL